MTTDIQPSTPASLAEISGALQLLFDALPFQRGAGSDNATAAYVEALRGNSVQSIQAGVSKFLKGECEGVNTRFVPTPPELARIIRAAIVPSRVPPQRRIAQPSMDAMANARMRMKMPLYRHATEIGCIAELDAANRDGFGAMVVLAKRWGVEIPAELLELTEEEAERQWRQARNRAWAEIERNPPPYLRRMKERAS